MKRSDLLDRKQLKAVPQSLITDLEFIDFIKNIGAVDQSIKDGIVKLVCEMSDFGLQGFNTKGLIAGCPNGFILFDFKGYDYNGSGEDREITGARYTSKNNQFSLLLIND